jgi:leader peptidase (prepilin peptidase)/N-methyltransferase
VLLLNGVIKRSYDMPGTEGSAESAQDSPEPEFNDRAEICKEIAFLLPIIACSVAAYLITRKIPAVQGFWQGLLQRPVLSGALGSLWGYFVGCAVVWATRIFGTLGFGKEAMGLGDVHLMGAAGAVVGAVSVSVAFFIAPFFGLAWAASQMITKKTRQIPYGPFLSLGVFAVMILRDQMFHYLSKIVYP